MDSFFQDEFKVNMGNKKDLTKDQLLAQNRKERNQREIARKQADATVIIQKYVRSYKSNCCLSNQIFGDNSLKLKETIAVFKAASIKQPIQKDSIFEKGIAKFQS